MWWKRKKQNESMAETFEFRMQICVYCICMLYWAAHACSLMANESQTYNWSILIACVNVLGKHYRVIDRDRDREREGDKECKKEDV